ncbi:hypothetical protein TNCV_4710151 [Trichonephila clavipes]|nr:hypothetical protein TNCV_4710151 [Trichonephila clavipes]
MGPLLLIGSLVDHSAISTLLSLGLRTIITMSDMETEPPDGANNKRQKKQKKNQKKAADPPPEETDNDKCRHHQEIQKLVKMMNGRLSFLEHCFKSEKKFQTSLTMTPSSDTKKRSRRLSSLKEHKLGGQSSPDRKQNPRSHFYGRARTEPRLPDIFQLKVLLPSGAGRHF